jgi:hypothetical protein
MPTKKRSEASRDEVTLTLSRNEANQLLAVLKNAEAVVAMLEQPPKQNFLGKLIKKAGKAVKNLS